MLTKEEYNKLRADSYNLKRLYEQYPYRVLVGFNSMIFSQDHEHYEQLFDDIEKRSIGEVRKETAEKFAEMAKEEAFVSFMGEPIIRASKIDEICKEFTGDKE